MGKSLIIAEKPDVARKMATTLGLKQQGDYFENDIYILVPLQGHVLEFYEPHDYNKEWKKWRRDDLPIIPTEFKWKISNKRAKIVGDLLKRSDVSLLINACDADREGEEIFREVVDHFGVKKPIKRLWLTEHSPSSILSGMKALKSENDILLGGSVTMSSLAKEARLAKKMDWVWGINLTRELSVVNNSLVSVGPVQTPTLNFIVTRFKEWDSFVPSQYWEVEATFAEGVTKAKVDKETAESLDLIGKIGNVLSVKKEQKQEQPPLLFDLTTLQAEANGSVGFSAARTLDLAQSLYESGSISYPRTDCKYLPVSVKERTVSWLRQQKEFSELPSPLPTRLFDDKKVEAHHAIVPLVNELGKDASADERRLFSIIRERTITAFKAPAKFVAIEAVIDVDGLEMKANGRVYSDYGFKKDAEENRCEFKEGTKTPVLSQSIEEKWTKAPDLLTEKTLLEMMASAGRRLDKDEFQDMADFSIGTPATRASIIELLIDRRYIERNGKKLIPTKKGIELIETIEEEIKSPEQRATTESWLRDVGRGSLDDNVVWDRYISQLKELLKIERSPIGETLGACPLCGKQVVANRGGFYGCSGYPDCKFNIGGKILGASIETNDIKTLLSGMSAGPFKFTSKTGEKFSAKLKISGEKLVFETVDAVSAVPCPKCKKMLTGGRKMTCSCGFVFWRQIAGYRMTDKEINKMFTSGKAGPFKMTSKAGNPFEAFVVWDGETTKFEFENKRKER